MKQRVLVADPAVASSGALRRFLDGAGFAVRPVAYLDEAVEAIRAREVHLAFAAVSHVFDGMQLCRKIKELDPTFPVVLLFPPDEEEPEPAAAAAGADAYLVDPLKRSAVVSCARAMARIRHLSEHVQRLERALEKRRRSEARDGGGREIDLFKRILLMEVKRSHRFRYPVSFLLVGLDGFEQAVADLTPEQQGHVIAGALVQIQRTIRDIDLAIPFPEHRFLVFLPHTPAAGATTVADRVRTRVASAAEGVFASVGVASFEPGQEKKAPSFGALLSEAAKRLGEAQAAGGDRVVAGRVARGSRVSIG